MAKVLITGGAGFIGTHLCRGLLKAGHSVRVLDLVSPEKPTANVDYRMGDVRKESDLLQSVQDVDAVFHFAAMVSVPLCQEKPVESTENNLVATAKVLDAIVKCAKQRKDAKPARLIFASSSVVYSDLGQQGVGLKEDVPTPMPLSFYGAQKLGSEQTIQLFNRHYGVPAVVFRFFNIYGSGQDPRSPYSGVISIFAGAVKDGRPLLLNAGGNQTRDFISVQDVVEANIKALEIPTELCDALPINLGSGKATSIRELAQEIMSAAGRRVTTLNSAARAGDIMHSLSDISRAKKILGWTPRVSMSEGLADLLKSI